MGKIELEFEKCLSKGQIKSFSDGPKLVGKQLKIAEGDLAEAQEGLTRKKWKWSTIQAYYSMFHTARALLYAKGFREHHHRCLRIAISHLYVSEDTAFHALVSDFQLAKMMRENADYADDFSENGANKLVSSAERFLKIVRKILRRPIQII